MYIDPADSRIIPFYKKMVELDLALLSHAGQKRSFAHARDELGDPKRLVLPLSLGVTVSAAHITSTCENEGEEGFLRLLPMFERYPNLYAGISSLTQINKLGLPKPRSRDERHCAADRIRIELALAALPSGAALVSSSACAACAIESGIKARQSVGPRCCLEKGHARAGTRLRALTNLAEDRAWLDNQQCSSRRNIER
jgi:hypothetical protein